MKFSRITVYMVMIELLILPGCLMSLLPLTRTESTGRDEILSFLHRDSEKRELFVTGPFCNQSNFRTNKHKYSSTTGKNRRFFDLYQSLYKTSFGSRFLSKLVTDIIEPKMDGPGAMIHDVELEAKAPLPPHPIPNTSHPFIGVMLAFFAAFLVGMSFIFQKKGLINMEKKSARNSDGKGKFIVNLKGNSCTCGTFL